MEVFVTNAIMVDGRPNIPVTTESPPWIQTALKENFIGLVRLDNNHIVLAVKTKNNGIMVAEPGDKISYDLMNDLVVEKRTTNTLTWDVVEKMIHERANPNTTPAKRKRSRSSRKK